DATAAARATAAAAAARATAAAAARATAAAIWRNIQSDAQNLVSVGTGAIGPLWVETSPLQERRESVQSILQESGQSEDWAFWIDWYNGLLNGTAPPANHPMFVEIALLPDEVWKDEPEALRQIDAIWKRHLAEQVIADNPIGVRIGYDAGKGKLNSFPFEERDLEQIVKDVRTALREFKSRCKKSTSNLGMAALSAFQNDIEQLREDVSKYKSNPRELLRVVEETRQSLARKAQDEGFGRDSNVDRLLGNLHNREDDICAMAPEVLEEVKRRLRVRSQRFSIEQMQAAIRMTAGMVTDSDGVLRMALARALFVVANDDCGEEEKAAAWTFLLGALPRGAKELNAVGKDGTDLSKDGSAMDMIVSAADKANKLDKGVDAIQEAVKEGGPWVTETFTQITSGNLWGVLGG
ncbi:MAG: hypothetical protein ACRBB0_21005, partial [Pelagimonas sp.]|uniref:hypothetical protein n=1 Tax=Pelagimonas sp. TaxID=2073170 RepID=UPI003D6A7711